MANEAGQGCADRTLGANGTTFVSKGAPATQDGWVTRLAFYQHSDTSGLGSASFAFFTASGDDITTIPGTRVSGLSYDATSVGCKEWTAAANDFTAFTVSAGDYLGGWGDKSVAYYSAGGSGYWYKAAGDYTNVSSVAFNLTASGYDSLTADIDTTPPTGGGSGGVYEPIVLCDLYLSSTILTGTRDVVVNSAHYRRGLIDFPELSQDLADIWYGVEQSSRVTLRFTNENNGVDDTWATILGSDDPRGAAVKISRYTVNDNVLTFQMRGKIVEWELTKTEFIIQVEMRDDEILETLLPQHVVTTDLFDATALDIGLPVNICFGKCYNVPLRNIQNDTVNNEYDYLIGYGTIEGLITSSGYGVKRDGVLVKSTEYTLYDGSQGSPYAGYAFIRFTVEQRDFSGRFHFITADVSGLELGGAAADRDFADCIDNLLTNTTWGLSDSVDSTSFGSATTAIDAINNGGGAGEMYCDGAITDQRKARYVLNDMLFACRGTIERAADGDWEISIDGTGSSVLNLGDNDGLYNNCNVIKRWSTPSTSSAKNIIVHYDLERYVLRDNPYKEINETVRTAFGVAKTYELPFVSEDNTALNIVGYLEGYELYGNEWVAVEAEIEAKDLNRGDIFTLTESHTGISAVTYKATRVSRNNKDIFYIEGRKYSASIHSNTGTATGPTAQTLPSDTVSGPQSIVGSNKLGDGDTQPGTLTLVVAAGQGDTWVAAGKTDFTNVQSGFILGIDDSDSDKAKFYIGDSSYYLNWTGAALDIKGNLNIASNTCYNTARANGSSTESGSSHTVAGVLITTGDLKIYNGADITFYSDAGSTQSGVMYNNSGSLQIQAVANLYLMAGGSNYIRLSADEVYITADSSTVIEFYSSEIVVNLAVVRPSGALSYLGDTTYRWEGIYGKNLNLSGTVTIDGNAGYNGSFTNGDGNTVTVTDGIITGIA